MKARLLVATPTRLLGIPIRCATVRMRMDHSFQLWEHLTMRFSSLCVASPAVAILSIDLLCGLSGTAMSETAPITALPNVTVEAPLQRARPARPKRSAVIQTISRHTSPATQAASTAPDSDSAKLAKLARITSSCLDGCQTSYKHGTAAWVGCSFSNLSVMSSTCRNVGNFKSYQECREGWMLLGWGTMEVNWYCSSLAAKYAWAK